MITHAVSVYSYNQSSDVDRDLEREEDNQRHHHPDDEHRDTNRNRRHIYLDDVPHTEAARRTCG